MLATFSQDTPTVSIPKFDFQLVRRLPLMYLLLGLSTTFLFGADRKHFYRTGHHDWVSSEHLTNAVNLSPDHNFLGFTHQIYTTDGASWYEAYNRFPPGGYALIKIATLPFEGLSERIYAARILMLVLFSMTAVLAYWSLCRLTSSRWISLTATLVAFSSFPAMYYNDMISNEVGIGLFAVMLSFHAMVIFEQEDRFRQLVVKSCIALLFDWRVLALLAAFIILSLAREIFREWIQESKRAKHTGSNFIFWKLKSLGRLSRRLVFNSRYMLLGGVVILFGTGIFIYNIGQEYYSLSQTSDIAIGELPSVTSALARTGLATSALEETHSFVWIPFLKQQLAQIGEASILFALYEVLLSVSNMGSWTSLYAAAVLGVCVAGVRLLNFKMLTVTLLCSGFFWAIPMRHSVTFHDYEALFYIGIPLVFVVSVMMHINKLTKHKLSDHIWPLATVALLGFIFSSFQMSLVGHNAERIKYHEAVIDDFEVIRRITDGENVYVPIVDKYPLYIAFTGVRHGLDYYLSGSGIVLYDTEPINRMRPPRFMIRLERHEENYNLLTPNNNRIFLYDLEASQ